MRHQFGQRLLDLRAEQPGVVLQVGKEARAVRAQHVEHLARHAGQHRIVDHRRAGRLLPMAERIAFAQQHRRAADRPRLATGRVAAFRRPPPRDAAYGAQLVEHRRRVVVDACRQQVFFPGRGRRRKAFELAQRVGQAAFALAPLVAVAGVQLVPAEQEAHELRRRHRLEFGAQFVARAAVDARQQAPVAPFVCTGGGQRAAHHRALRFELQQGGQHGIAVHSQWRAQRFGGDGAEQFEAAAQDLAQGVVGCGRSVEVAAIGGDSAASREDRQEFVQALGRDQERGA